VTHLQIKTFGKFQLHYKGQVAAHFPTQSVEELLAFLVLHPHLKHSRLKLIDLLWPDCSEQQGRGRLNTAVWRLRGVFDALGFAYEDVLLTSRSWISIHAKSAMQVDCKTFEKYQQSASQEEDLTQKEAWLRQALVLYQGEFCEGIYADWCLLERERLARLHLRTLGQLMHCYMQSSEYEKAVEIGQQILQVDPLREEVHRALMRCYYRLEQYTQAIRQFHTCSRLLQSELQVYPMPATVTLFSQIAAERSSGLRQPTNASHSLTDEIQEAVFQLQTASRNLSQLLVKYEPDTYTPDQTARQ
jgi:DNA-binding SARP family transcriptional activator